jgi:hypothetical protein
MYSFLMLILLEHQATNRIEKVKLNVHKLCYVRLTIQTVITVNVGTHCNVTVYRNAVS